MRTTHMKFSSSSRILTMLLALCSMLFMQLALASYVCPVMTNGPAPVTMAEMPGCDGTDMQQPALCHAHSQDQAAKQSLDKPDLPQVAAFITGNWVRVISALDLSASQGPRFAKRAPQHLALAPDIAILHCCFRI